MVDEGANAALTEEERSNLGVGMKFLQEWDYEIVGGSIDTITGLRTLGRDLSFVTQQEMRGERGGLRNRNYLRDVEIITEDAVSSDERVKSVDSTEASLTDDTQQQVEVTVLVTIETGEKAEFVFPIE